jgi:hypothetical protein
MAKYKYRIRREFLALPSARHEELIALSKPAWYSCSIVIKAGAVFGPLCILIGGMFGIRALLGPLPKVASLFIAVLATLFLYCGPKLFLRLSKRSTLHCIQAACLRHFAKQRLRAG